MVQASDPVFSDARLAPWYDVFEGARDDLESGIGLTRRGSEQTRG